MRLNQQLQLANRQQPKINFMIKVKVYNQTGQEIKEIDLDKKIFAVKIKPTVVAEVVAGLLANQRLPYAHTKDRGDVRGGGKKPWKQKGTGRARHGSIRSPLWIGGGVTFGPSKDRNFTKKINKKMKRSVLLMILSDRAATESLLVFDDIKFNEIKTKKFAEFLQLKPLQNKKILLVLDQIDKNIERSARNISQVKVTTVNSLNLLDVLAWPYLLITEKAMSNLVKKYNVVL